MAAPLRLGERIDEELVAGDVRLTMGGEPTFVSIDDMDGEEWNTAALGPAKLKRAKELLLRLREEFGKGGLAPLWAGKMVPRRAAAALDFHLFLANRRRAPLERSCWLAETDRDYGFGSTPRGSLPKNWPSVWELGPATSSRLTRTRWPIC